MCIFRWFGILLFWFKLNGWDILLVAISLIIMWNMFIFNGIVSCKSTSIIGASVHWPPAHTHTYNYDSQWNWIIKLQHILHQIYIKWSFSSIWYNWRRPHYDLFQTIPFRFLHFPTSPLWLYARQMVHCMNETEILPSINFYQNHNRLKLCLMSSDWECYFSLHSWYSVCVVNMILLWCSEFKMLFKMKGQKSHKLYSQSWWIVFVIK